MQGSEARLHGGAAVSSSPSNLIPLTIYNTSGSSLTNVSVPFEQPFKTGDVPSSSKIQILDSDQVTPLTTEEASCSVWAQDGSRKACIVVPPPLNISGTSKTIYLQGVSGTPNTTPNVSAAQITANTNICYKATSLQEASGTAETGTWDLNCLNHVINSCPQYSGSTGYGSNPTCGWEYFAQGPNMVGIHAFSYPIRESDSAVQSWIRTDMWVKFLGSGSTPCPCKVSAMVTEPNSFGGISGGTVGPTIMGAFNLASTLYNGSNVIFSSGGSADPRVISTLTGSSFNGSTNILTLPSGNWSENVQGIFPVAFSSTGTLPSGITAGTVYWIFIGSGGSVDTTYVYQYQCNATGGEGSCTQGGIALGTGGSGTITMTPYVYTNPWGGFALLDSTAQEIPINAAGTAGTQAPITIGHDFTYLTQKTKATLPYITTLAGALKPFPNTLLYYPGSYYIAYDMNTTGDSPGDLRIGDIDHYGAYALFQGSDAAALQGSRVFGASMALYHVYHIDETVGLPVIWNDGPLKNGTTKYTTMGANYPTYRTFPFSVSPFISNPYNGNYDVGAFYDRYSVWADPSHLPLPQQVPLLESGDPMWEWNMVQTFNAVVGNMYQTSYPINSTTYYRPISVNNQPRGMGWWSRIANRVSYYEPANSPVLPYVKDVINDNFNFLPDYMTNVATTAMQSLGYYPFDVPANYNGGVQPWEDDFIYMETAMFQWQGEYSGPGTWLTNWFNKFAWGRMDNTNGGCPWAAASRSIDPSTAGTNQNNSPTNLATNWQDIYSLSAASQGFPGGAVGWQGTLTSQFSGTVTGSTSLTTNSALTPLGSPNTSDWYFSYGEQIPSGENTYQFGLKLTSGSGTNWTLNLPTVNTTVSGGSFTGTSSGTTITAASVSGKIQWYQLLSGTGIPTGTRTIYPGGSGTGGAGTYLTDNSTTASGTTVNNSDMFWGSTFSCPTSGIIADGGSNAGEPVSLANDAVGTAAMASVLGLTNATSTYNAYRNYQYNTYSPALTFTNYQYQTGFFGSFPEWAFGPLGATQ